MSERLKVLVNGKPYEVEIQSLDSSPMQVTVNGTAYTVSVEGGEVAALKPVSSPAAAAPVQAVISAPMTPPPAAAAPANGSSGVVAAPMPGVILDIVVKAGDSVKRGDQLCALEAMKMKSAIRSPRDGVIAVVEVTDGQRITHGQVIVRFA